MIKFTTVKIFLLLINYSLIVFTLQGQSIIEASPHINIEGTSNILSWKANSNSGNVKSLVVFESGRIANITDIQATIPVITLKSDKGKKMDTKMYQALKADLFPFIKFSLHNVDKVVWNSEETNIYATGFLEIAGKKKLVNLGVNAQEIDNQTLVIRLSEKIRMSDYDIAPPTALFGLIATGDEVTINIQFKIQTSEK